METVEFGCGMSINAACGLLLKEAKTSADKKAQDVFNDITITASHCDTIESLVERWYSDSDAAMKAWRNSPAGIKAEEDARDRLEKATEAHNRCMARLPGLDFCNDGDLLDWMAEFQDAADHVGVKNTRRLFCLHSKTAAALSQT